MSDPTAATSKLGDLQSAQHQHLHAAPAPRAMPEPEPSDTLAHALAGSGGGLLSMALTYPLITLSTRAQVESQRAHLSTVDAARRIVKREGLGGLYAGMESAMVGIGVTNFVYYYWYEFTRSLFLRAALRSSRASASLTTLESMAAGAIAGSATVLITNPIWVVNTRMTARKRHDSDADSDSDAVLPGGGDAASRPAKSKSKSPSTLGTLLALLRDEGPARLFAGVLPALVLVINPILQYTVFEQLKNLLERRRKGRGITATDAFYLGALGKLLATSITYPYITVKSRMHVATKEEGRGEGVVAALRRVVREEGWGGLYGGIGPKVTQSVITAAFLFAFKDLLYAYTVQARKRLAIRSAR